MFQFCIASPAQIRNIYGELLGTMLFLKQAFWGLSIIYGSVPSKKVKKEPDGQI